MMPDLRLTRQIIEAYPTRMGVTGTRAPTAGILEAISLQIRDMYKQGAVLITGGCIGADAHAARCARALDIPVHVILPSDRSRVDPEWDKYCTSLHAMPAGSSYKDRNAEVVRCSTMLMAFPSAPEAAPESRRSGTWMTVRLARAAAIPVFVVRSYR